MQRRLRWIGLNLLLLVLLLAVYSFAISSIEWLARGSAGDPNRDSATYMDDASIGTFYFGMAMVPAAIPYLLMLCHFARGRPHSIQRLLALALSPVTASFLWFVFHNFVDSLLSVVILLIPVVGFALLVRLPPPTSTQRTAASNT